MGNVTNVGSNAGTQLGLAMMNGSGVQGVGGSNPLVPTYIESYFS